MRIMQDRINTLSTRNCTLLCFWKNMRGEKCALEIMKENSNEEQKRRIEEAFGSGCEMRKESPPQENS